MSDRNAGIRRGDAGPGVDGDVATVTAEFIDQNDNARAVSGVYRTIGHDPGVAGPEAFDEDTGVSGGDRVCGDIDQAVFYMVHLNADETCVDVVGDVEEHIAVARLRDLEAGV